MKIRIGCILLILTLIGCEKPREYSVSDFQNLNGYWEITEVIYPNGEKKKYTISTTVDFIKIDSLIGYRKKVQPKLDGTFTASEDQINFRILKKSDKGYFFTYENGIDSWQEGVNFLGVDYFSVKTIDGLVYCYDRYKPIDITSDGKTTE